MLTKYTHPAAAAEATDAAVLPSMVAEGGGDQRKGGSAGVQWALWMASEVAGGTWRTLQVRQAEEMEQVATFFHSASTADL